MAMTTPLCMFSCVYNTKISNFYAVTAGSEGCKLCVCGFVSVGQLSNSVSHCNVLFRIVPQKDHATGFTSVLVRGLGNKRS